MDGFNPFDFIKNKGFLSIMESLDNLQQRSWLEKYINNILGPNFWSLVTENPVQDLNQKKIEIFQTTDEVIVIGEIPGLDKESDIRIFIRGMTLFLETATPADTTHKINLPAPVSSFGAKALYKNGIMEIRLPKEPLPNESHVDIQFL